MYIHNRGGNNKRSFPSLIKINFYKTMPRRNGTGPLGIGAGTGWGLGPCGGGMRRGWGCWSGGFKSRRFASPKDELVALEYEEKMFEEGLSAIHEEKATLKGQQK